MRRCLVCDELGAHQHHALPKSVWPELRDHPDVLIPLCFRCHQAWHDGLGPVSADMMPYRTLCLITKHAPGAWVQQWYPPRPHADVPF
jgi:hypothetical protein